MNAPANIVWPEPTVADHKAAIGVAMHALNIAAGQIERLGGDASIQREAVAEISPLRGVA